MAIIKRGGDDTEEPGTIHITHGYSRDHRPDLKQFMVDLMCSGDGDIPLYMRVGDGNETDSALFAQLIVEFRQQWDVDALFVADAALYTASNLQQMAQLRWVSRVPATLTSAKDLLQHIHPDALVPSSLPGYQIAACGNSYAQIPQRWLAVKSQARLVSDLKQLEKRLAKQETLAVCALKQLQSQQFSCRPDALAKAASFSQQLPYHPLQDLQAIEIVEHKRRGRPRKDAVGQKHYQISAVLVPKDSVIDAERQCARLFLLATNVLDDQVLSDDQILREYKAQQSTKRGFRFLKDPLFFTSSVFLKTPQRVAALAMLKWVYVC
jgi:transposase